MILINLQLTILGNPPNYAIAASPFLGGVLHGSFEHLIRLHDPKLANELGMIHGSQLKYYAVLPPPYGWKPDTTQNPTFLACGIMLFGQAKQHLKEILSILHNWHEIRLKGRIDRIEQQRIYLCSPGKQPQLWRQSDQDLIDNNKLDFNHIFTARDSIKIDLITPLKLESAQQKAKNVHTSPPDLLRIVRSLAKRIQKLEPDLASYLEIDSLDWIEAEEQIRHLSIKKYQLENVQWRYGSCTKQHPIHRNGLVGQIHYSGLIPASIAALLNWGCWFGIGQGISLGQGMYVIKGPQQKK